VETFRYQPAEDYFLIVSEMVPYKQLDYAIRWFAQSGRRLKVVGDGPEYKSLKKQAGSRVEFAGRVTDSELRDLYSRCRALIVPGEEDFGINMVEAMASGKPVVALARGGAIETVENGHGVLYPEPDEAALSEALRSFDRVESLIDPRGLIEYASEYSETAFQERFLDALGGMSKRRSKPPASRPARGPVLLRPVEPVASLASLAAGD
jgi:glycosyltransferase involved in cell wall biosynthesis